MLLLLVIFEWKVEKVKEDFFDRCLFENRFYFDVWERGIKIEKKSDFVIGLCYFDRIW